MCVGDRQVELGWNPLLAVLGVGASSGGHRAWRRRAVARGLSGQPHVLQWALWKSWGDAHHWHCGLYGGQRRRGWALDGSTGPLGPQIILPVTWRLSTCSHFPAQDLHTHPCPFKWHQHLTLEVGKWRVGAGPSISMCLEPGGACLLCRSPAPGSPPACRNGPLPSCSSRGFSLLRCVVSSFLRCEPLGGGFWGVHPCSHTWPRAHHLRSYGGSHCREHPWCALHGSRASSSGMGWP